MTATQLLKEIERTVVLGESHTDKFGSARDCTTDDDDFSFLCFLADCIVRGDCVSIFTDERVKRVINVSSAAALSKEIAEKCENYLQNASHCRTLAVLLIGVSALKLFVQCNWTGPAVSFESDVFPNGNSEEQQLRCLQALEIGGEQPYHLIEQPNFLIIAKALLLDCGVMLRSCWTADWWAWRCAYVHQLIMLDRSHELYRKICERIAKVESNLPSGNESDEQRKLNMVFYTEAAMSHVYHFEVRSSRSYLEMAKNVSNLEFQLTGALGKRTYHQKNELAQLLLEVQHKGSGDLQDLPKETPKHFPRNVPLSDDTVMNEVKFSSEAPSGICLTLEEASLLLAVCILNKSISAPDALRDEEMMAYVERVLAVPRAWSVQFSALFHRCRLECKSSRRVERSMSQLQCLVDAVNSSDPHAGFRQELFFCVAMPSIWQVEKELGNLFFALGATKSALDVFMKYELWEEVIDCYTKIGRRDRAEGIVRKLLEQSETAHLYCLLGDATQDPEHYSKAWEISGHSSARAQRSLGMFHYNKKQFAEAIPHLEKSTELNGMHLNAWFALGYSAMQVEDYDLSVKAYKRVVSLDPENLEAWNNMASAYIHMGDKAKAWRVLQEALKCSYDNWRVWENYLLVCMDVGAFEECITAWHRLIDIKGKHSDGKVAKLLVRVVAEAIPDMHGKPGTHLKPKLLELFGRVTSVVTTDADIWYSYASLYRISSEGSNTTVEEIERMLQFFQKSFRCHGQKQNWEKDAVTCKEHLVRSRELLEIYVSVTKGVSDVARKRQLLSSARITVKGTLSLVQNYRVNYTPQTLDELAPLIDSLAAKLEEVSQLVDSLN